MEIKIEANKELFDEWESLGLQIGNLRTIVQNNIEISKAEMVDWLDESTSLQTKFKNLHDDTFNYVVRSERNVFGRR